MTATDKLNSAARSMGWATFTGCEQSGSVNGNGLRVCEGYTRWGMIYHSLT